MHILVNILTILLLIPVMMVLKPLFFLFLIGHAIIVAIKSKEEAPFFMLFLFVLVAPLVALHTAFHLLFDSGLSKMTTKEIFLNLLDMGH